MYSAQRAPDIKCYEKGFSKILVLEEERDIIYVLVLIMKYIQPNSKTKRNFARAL